MITTFSIIAGLVGSALPEVLKIFNRKYDVQQQQNQFDHELKMLEAKTRNAAELSRLEIDKINVTADATEGDSVRNHDAAISGGRFMDALRASVRPVITYALFLTFVVIKSLAVAEAMETNTLLNSLQTVWDTETQALFAAIIAFWFGSRTIERMKPAPKFGGGIY